jgi:hypothetical protein
MSATYPGGMRTRFIVNDECLGERGRRAFLAAGDRRQFDIQLGAMRDMTSTQTIASPRALPDSSTRRAKASNA